MKYPKKNLKFIMFSLMFALTYSANAQRLSNIELAELNMKIDSILFETFMKDSNLVDSTFQSHDSGFFDISFKINRVDLLTISLNELFYGDNKNLERINQVRIVHKIRIQTNVQNADIYLIPQTIWLKYVRLNMDLFAVLHDLKDKGSYYLGSSGGPYSNVLSRVYQVVIVKEDRILHKRRVTVYHNKQVVNAY